MLKWINRWSKNRINWLIEVISSQNEVFHLFHCNLFVLNQCSISKENLGWCSCKSVRSTKCGEDCWYQTNKHHIHLSRRSRKYQSRTEQIPNCRSENGRQMSIHTNRFYQRTTRWHRNNFQAYILGSRHSIQFHLLPQSMINNEIHWYFTCCLTCFSLR